MDYFVNCIDKFKKLILESFDYLWCNPETGYKEWNTHRYLKDKIESFGYNVVEAGNIPGFYAEVDTMRPGPTVLVFAEMDALTVPSHPDANPQTGAVHACGHCTQFYQCPA